MSLSLAKRATSQELRKVGYSMAEIAGKLKISKSTVSLWVRNVTLSDQAKQRIQSRKELGRAKGLFSKKAAELVEIAAIQTTVNNLYCQTDLNKNYFKLLSAFLYWGEGSKNSNCVSFINSDPVMMKTFVTLLRKSFEIDERKLRVLLHLHDYHNEVELKQFWSKVTEVPISQFSKIYQKKHTQNTIKDGYKGCCRLRYYDVKIVRELKALYNSFPSKIGVSVNW